MEHKGPALLDPASKREKRGENEIKIVYIVGVDGVTSKTKGRERERRRILEPFFTLALSTRAAVIFSL